ncbi:MAG TPA: methionine--tRNA ligase [Nitrososphaera sp.]|nr:methionine--tRNA ligase [Nitrososphaera sp.]
MPDKTISQNRVITSALPYANGEIHLGHIASTYLPADIFTRFLRLKGLKAYHICASDDFGTPILIRSEKEKKSPQDYVEYWNRQDKEDFESLGISFDFFYKTSSKENVEFVQYVFKQLHENGHIYNQNVIQFYCTYDNKFLPDRYVIGRCPYCNAENQYSDLCEKCGRVPDQILEPKCAICCRPPVKKESKHYFFRLSSFKEKLKDWLLSNHHLQTDVKNYVIDWINEGLQDWDITRDLSWGIPIPLPEAKGKVFYGWFDNHLCYISSLVKLVNDRGDNGKKFWNESEIYHFIGKDIIYHHYLFLPAIRLGINSEYKLPDYIPTRGHLMLQNQKISKSRSWYIGLKDFTSAFNPDFLRFYIASVVTYSQDDLNFDFNAFYERINNELIANVGNFINRALSFTHKSFQGIVPEPSHIDDIIEKELAAAVDETGSLLSSNEIDKALKRILKYSNYMNHYFQTNSPWANKDTSNTTVYVSVNAVRSLAVLLEPFIPFSCEKIWAQLKLGGGSIHQQVWESAKNIRAIPAGHEIGKVEPIFRKVEAKEIEDWKNNLGKPQ